MMKKNYFNLLLTLLLSTLSLVSYGQENTEHEKWLMDKFSAKHETLIPVVAVANIFAGCNQTRKVDPIQYQVKELVQKMPKEQLSDKVLLCLGADDLQSSIAIDFGLIGCFYSQFSYLSIPEKKEKIAQVKLALAELSLEERKKSFAECTTIQAIKYIQ